MHELIKSIPILGTLRLSISAAVSSVLVQSTVKFKHFVVSLKLFWNLQHTSHLSGGIGSQTRWTLWIQIRSLMDWFVYCK